LSEWLRVDDSLLAEGVEEQIVQMLRWSLSNVAVFVQLNELQGWASGRTIASSCLHWPTNTTWKFV